MEHKLRVYEFTLSELLETIRINADSVCGSNGLALDCGDYMKEADPPSFNCIDDMLLGCTYAVSCGFIPILR